MLRLKLKRWIGQILERMIGEDEFVHLQAKKADKVKAMLSGRPYQAYRLGEKTKP